MHNTVVRNGRLAATLATSALLIAGLAACSSTPAPAPTKSSGAATTNTSAAQANLDKYLATKAPVTVGSAFDASKASGKVVEVIDLTGANPAVAAVSQSVRSALAHEKVGVQRCDAGGVSVNITNCIGQGISQSVKAIVVVGGDPATYSQGIASAHTAGIPIVSALDFPLATEVTASGVNASALASDTKLVSGNAAPPDALSGTLAADYIINDSKGHANILFIASPGIVGSTYVQDAFNVELKKRCPNCTLTSASVALPSWSSDLGATVSAKLAQDPRIDYVVPVFDPMAAYTDPAINQSGTTSVKVVTVNGSVQQMQDLSQKTLIAAEVGQSLPQMAFIAADETLRFLDGATPVKEAATAVRVFTSANIGSIAVSDATFSTGQWYTGSPTALTDAYYKLWSK